MVPASAKPIRLSKDGSTLANRFQWLRDIGSGNVYGMSSSGEVALFGSLLAFWGQSNR